MIAPKGRPRATSGVTIAERTSSAQHLEMLGVHRSRSERLRRERLGGNELRLAGADDEGKASGRIGGKGKAPLDLARERGMLRAAAGDCDVDERILPTRLGGFVEHRDAAPVGERLDGELAQRADRRHDVERLGEPRTGVREKALAVSGEAVGELEVRRRGSGERRGRHAETCVCAALDARASVRSVNLGVSEGARKHARSIVTLERSRSARQRVPSLTLVFAPVYTGRPQM